MNNEELTQIENLIDEKLEAEPGINHILERLKTKVIQEMENEKYTVHWSMQTNSTSPLKAAKQIKSGFFADVPVFSKVRVTDSTCGSFVSCREFEVDLETNEVKEIL